MISVVETEASDKKLCGGSVIVGCYHFCTGVFASKFWAGWMRLTELPSACQASTDAKTSIYIHRWSRFCVVYSFI